MASNLTFRNAIVAKDLALVEQLLREGVSPDAEMPMYGDVTHGSDSPALAVAIARGSIEIVHALLAAGASVAHGGLLTAAVESGSLEVARLLLARNASRDARRRYGAMHQAAYCFQYDGKPDRTAIVHELLAAGFDVNARDDEGRTPLFEATYGGCVAITKLLVGVPGIDVNARNGARMTPIMNVEVDDGDNVLQIAKLLVEAGADIDAQRDMGDTVLSYHFCRPDVALFLMACGVDVNPKNCRPFHQNGPPAASCFYARAAGCSQQLCRFDDSLYVAELAAAKRALAKAQVDLIRARATEALIGLQPLRISAGELMEVIEFACEPFSNCVPLAIKWKLIVTVKNFLR
jgi:hypothetical protein